MLCGGWEADSGPRDRVRRFRILLVHPPDAGQPEVYTR